MKQLFDLTCPFCNHSHHAGYLPYTSNGLTIQVFDQPIICDNCHQGLLVVVEQIDENTEQITFSSNPTPTFPGWLFWNIDPESPYFFRTSKIAMLASPAVLNDPNADCQYLIDAKQELQNAMRNSRAYINEGRSLAVGTSSVSENRHISSVYLLEASYLLPVAWEPTLRDAASAVTGFAELAIAFCKTSENFTMTIVTDEDTYGWQHTLMTARVVDYMLRNPWFATMLESAINRHFKHHIYRPLIGIRDDDTYCFNANYAADISPLWVPLYPADHRVLSYEELKTILDSNLTIEQHLEHAEQFSPDRAVMYSTEGMPEPGAMSNVPTDLAPTAKKKPILH